VWGRNRGTFGVSDDVSNALTARRLFNGIPADTSARELVQFPANGTTRRHDQAPQQP